jgi:hypothetical protein
LQAFERALRAAQVEPAVDLGDEAL